MRHRIQLEEDAVHAAITRQTLQHRPALPSNSDSSRVLYLRFRSLIGRRGCRPGLKHLRDTAARQERPRHAPAFIDLRQREPLQIGPVPAGRCRRPWSGRRQLLQMEEWPDKAWLTLTDSRRSKEANVRVSPDDPSASKSALLGRVRPKRRPLRPVPPPHSPTYQRSTLDSSHATFKFTASAGQLWSRQSLTSVPPIIPRLVGSGR